MSTGLTSSQQNERWEVGDQTWSRNPTTGAFDLLDYRGLGRPPAAHNPLDLATLIGGRVSIDGPDRGASRVALYPGAFEFSPITGKALPHPAATHLDAWLPPFGGHASATDRPQGLRLTAVRLTLRRTLSIESLPDRQLAMPPAGNYQFLVSAFGARECRLFALEFSRGLIVQWLPHSECWREISPGGTEVLARSSLADNAWGLAAQDPQGSTRIFMPTDNGLAIVSINPIAQTYELRTVGHRCAGAPVMWQGRVCVPMVEGGKRLGIFTLDPQGTAVRRIDGPALDAASGWVRPLADRRQIVWMASSGQLVVRRNGGTALEASLLPWPWGITPRFDLGSPYLSDGGQLWQQCLLRDDQGSRLVFVQLGRSEPEIKPASDSDDRGMASSAHEVIFPLLESSSASTLLRARVASTRSLDAVLASNETFTTLFELRGAQDVQFWVARMPRPWATRPFVYAGHLYLYHPDKRRLPGWRIGTEP